MGQILGLGITHYPGLSYKGNLTRRIKLLLADPLLPERLRSPEQRNELDGHYECLCARAARRRA